MEKVSFIPSNVLVPSILYKYREVNKYSLSSLLCNQVFFAKPQDFNDPYEPLKVFEESDFGAVLQRNVNDAGILCLCGEPTNLAMWSYYGAALKGIAIGYKTDTLLESVAPEEFKAVYQVNYDSLAVPFIETAEIIKSNPEERNPQEVKMFATKADAFRHENEFRIVIGADANFEYPGYGLYDHAPDAIAEIIFGELITDGDVKLVREALRGRDVVFKRATRCKSEYKIEIQ